MHTADSTAYMSKPPQRSNILHQKKPPLALIILLLRKCAIGKNWQSAWFVSSTPASNNARGYRPRPSDPPTQHNPNPRPLPKVLDRAIVNIPKHKSSVQHASFPRHENLIRYLLRVRTVTTALAVHYSLMSAPLQLLCLLLIYKQRCPPKLIALTLQHKHYAFSRTVLTLTYVA